MFRVLFKHFFALLMTLLINTTAGHAASEITTIPEEISLSCRGGMAELYDECSDQQELFLKAQKIAVDEGKVLLISYGAEWCIWCHVFNAYIHGQHTLFAPTFSDSDDVVRARELMYERAKTDIRPLAVDLHNYVARHFVVLHIDSRYAPGSFEVLEMTEAEQHFDDGLPFIFTVNSDGMFAQQTNHDLIEMRRDTEDWFRGYDRKGLLKMLQQMHAAAASPK